MDVVSEKIPSLSDDANYCTMHNLLIKQQQAFMADPVVNFDIRADRIDRVIELLVKNQKPLMEATSEDFGNRSQHQAQMADIMSTINALKYSKKHLNDWMYAQKRKVSFPLNLFGAKARVEYQPKGVVGNISTWNFPIHVAFSPLAGIFAAGNRCMMKLSELTPETSALTQELIDQYFDETELVAINGGPEVGSQFAALPFDHLLFTGSTQIGKHILHAAADNLTPVTLELGGKSPVIIGRETNLTLAANKIINGKAMNMGQVCLSPDYCFVPKENLYTLITAIKTRFKALFPTVYDNPDYTSVINDKHYHRIQSCIDDARQKGADVVDLSESTVGSSDTKNRIPLHLVINPSDDMRVMQEELFGPILCIKTYKHIEETTAYINANARPLALYYFGDNKHEERYILDNTISGGVAINDVMTHVSCEDLPFGGIGNSGMGCYHGHDGFKTFSHPKAVYRQSRVNFMELAGMIPPYGDKCKKQLDKLTDNR